MDEIMEPFSPSLWLYTKKRASRLILHLSVPNLFMLSRKIYILSSLDPRKQPVVNNSGIIGHAAVRLVWIDKLDHKIRE
jgi:hypothetical protein